MSEQRTWPESPDGSFWVRWDETTEAATRYEGERTEATACSQLGGRATYDWTGRAWRLREWVSGGFA